MLPPSAILMAMDSRLTPNIASFVIRFVIESALADGLTHVPYRGAIRHIQTDEEVNFKCWEDVENFVRRYVPLETETGQDSA